MNDTMKLDVLFKQNSSKISSDLSKKHFEEAYVNQKYINPTRIMSQANLIPNTPAVIPSVIEFISISLNIDETVSGNKAWFTSDSNGDFIPPSFGAGYTIKLYDGNNTRILESDISEWIFYYESGHLTFFGDNSHHNINSYRIEAYRYIGTWGTLSGEGISELSITQNAHGFVRGNLITKTLTGNYIKCLAVTTIESISDVMGIVTDVIDSNNFKFKYIFGDFLFTGVGHFPTGYSGDALFLSSTVAGEMTTVTPNVNGTVSKPVGYIVVPNQRIVLYNMRGIEINNMTEPPVNNGNEYDYYVTAGDYNDLRQAVENPNYKSIFVPNGSYEKSAGLTNFLTINTNKIIHGEGNSVIFSCGAENINTGIFIGNVTVELKNIHLFKIEKSTPDSSWVYGIYNNGYLTCENVVISHIDNISGDSGPAIGIMTMSNKKLDIKNSYINGISSAVVSYGIYNENIPSLISNSDKSEISNCSFESVGIAIYNGININNCKFNGIDYIGLNTCKMISNSKFENCNITMQNCENINNIEIINIIAQAMLFCSNISNISLMQTTQRIIGNTFHSCNNINDIKIVGGTTIANSSFMNVFNACKNISNIVMEFIYGNCFINCENIENIEISKSNISISSQAMFLNCNSINNVKIESNGVSLNPTNRNICFDNCSYLDNCFINGSNIITEVGINTAFQNSNFISNSKAINTAINGFSNCEKLSNCYSNCNSDPILTTSSEFNNCRYLVNCVSVSKATPVTLTGFKSCTLLTNCRAEVNQDNKGYDSCDWLVNCTSNHNEVFGTNKTQCFQSV